MSKDYVALERERERERERANKGLWLHLGGGRRVLPGAMHIDIGDFSHLDYHHDFRNLPMIDSGSCDGVYASHCFEYVDVPEALTVLREWRRVLKPGGILRLAVPNFSALCAVYTETGDISNVLGPIFGRWDPDAGSSAAGVKKVDRVVFHKTVYDAASLTTALMSAGFHDVRPWDWREVFTGDWQGFDDFSQAYYPHMDKEHGRLMSLNLEATA